MKRIRSVLHLGFLTAAFLVAWLLPLFLYVKLGVTSGYFVFGVLLYYIGIVWCYGDRLQKWRGNLGSE